MPEATPVYPFTAFNFSVEITRDGESSTLCNAAFSECDGLEMTMEVKTIREGGNNNQQIRLAGPVAYGQLTLKRGMTDGFDLWNWFTESALNPALRASAQVVMFATNGSTVRARFSLSRCLPVKIKSPALNAKDGLVAIEELQLVYEEMTLA
jgi:phage tail-like protein